MKLKLVALALGALAACGAQAQQGMYAGAVLTRVAYQEDGVPDAYPIAIAGRIGAQINQNFAVEARLGTGLADDSVSVSGLDVGVEVDNYIGAYVKGILPISGAFSMYGLLGYTRGELTASTAFGSVSESDSDVSIGFGADFAMNDRTSIGLEWARLFSGADYEADGLSVSVAFKF